MKVLIIEDEENLLRLTKSELEKEGYKVDFSTTLANATDKILSTSYDCILLDIMLPDGNGLSILKTLKNLGREDNVIILSAKDSIDDKVNGLDLGADDYLAKPYHIAEVSARIKTIIRRKNPSNKNGCFGNVCILSAEKKVLVNNKEITLKKKEFEILEFFSNRINRLIDKDKLAEFIWEENFDSMGNYDFLYTQMKNLRKKLKDSNASLELKSIYGIGYKLIEKENESSL
jgi:DNA-binding response OmpR family regulator